MNNREVYIREPLSGKILAYWGGEYVRKPYNGQVVVSVDGDYIREGTSGGQYWLILMAVLSGKGFREVE